MPRPLPDVACFGVCLPFLTERHRIVMYFLIAPLTLGPTTHKEKINADRNGDDNNLCFAFRSCLLLPSSCFFLSFFKRKWGEILLLLSTGCLLLSSFFMCGRRLVLKLSCKASLLGRERRRSSLSPQPPSMKVISCYP